MAILKIMNNDYSNYYTTEVVINYIFHHEPVNGYCGCQKLYCSDIQTISCQFNNIARYYNISGNILHHFVLSFDKDTEGWIYYNPESPKRSS